MNIKYNLALIRFDIFYYCYNAFGNSNFQKATPAKFKKMKYILIVLTLLGQVSTAQTIIPLENLSSYRKAGNGVPDNSYFKDVNHVLDQYIGSWMGVQNGKTYVFYIIKEVENTIISQYDRLVIRYTIHSETGRLIEDSRFVPSDDEKALQGWSYTHTGTYYLNYNYNVKASMTGTVSIKQSGIPNKIKLKLTINAEMMFASEVEVGNQEALLPTTEILLTKQ